MSQRVTVCRQTEIWVLAQPLTNVTLGQSLILFVPLPAKEDDGITLNTHVRNHYTYMVAIIIIVMGGVGFEHEVEDWA